MKIHYIYIEYGSKEGKEPGNVGRLSDAATRLGLDPVFHTYSSVIDVICEVDEELGRLAKLINPCIPALIADIGRICVLYKFGGIYCDTKFVITKQCLNEVNKRLNTFGYAFWIHPKLNRCRNGCMAATGGHSEFLAIIGSMRRLLIGWEAVQSAKANARFNIFAVGYRFSEVLVRNKHVVRRNMRGDEPYFNWPVRSALGWNLNPPGYLHWTKAQRRMPIFIFDDHAHSPA